MEFLVVVKRDCETCQMVGPVLAGLKGALPLTLYSQDDPAFPEEAGGARDDRGLEESWRRKIEVVPTVIRIEDGEEIERTEGWDRNEWQRITGQGDLGAGLPDFKPGCGSRSLEPGMPERLSLQFGGMHLVARAIEVAEMEDPMEIAYDRGWTDGLPTVPPTDLRIARMLSGTTRKPDEIIGLIPPNLAECSIEKVAISADGRLPSGIHARSACSRRSGVEARILDAWVACDTWLCRTRGDCERSHHETHRDEFEGQRARPRQQGKCVDRADTTIIDTEHGWRHSPRDRPLRSWQSGQVHVLFCRRRRRRRLGTAQRRTWCDTWHIIRNALSRRRRARLCRLAF